MNKSCLASETLKYLNSSCMGPMCVQLEDYSQVRDNVQTYASGDVKIWIGTSYTTYGLYEVIPMVGLSGPHLGQASPPSPAPALISLNLKWGHRPSAIQAVGHSPSRLPRENLEKRKQMFIHRELRGCQGD